MIRTYCENGSGWACNEWGVRMARAGGRADELFRRGCELGFEPACRNREMQPGGAGSWVHGRPGLDDLPIVLRGTKPPLDGLSQAQLFGLACEQGWPDACDWEVGASTTP